MNDNIYESNDNIKKTKNINLLSIVSLMLLIVVTILGGTYAAFVVTKQESSTITGAASCYKVKYTKGQDINGVLEADTNFTSGWSTDIVMYAESGCEDLTATLYLTTNPDTTMDLSDKALKYTVVLNNSIVSEGSVDGTANQVIYNNFKLNTTQTTYRVYIWLDSALEDVTNFDSEAYSGFIHADVTATSDMSFSSPLYSQIDFIESTGTQYIDTGWTPPSNMNCEIQTQFMYTGTGVDQTIFGIGQSGNSAGLTLNGMVGTTYWQLGVNNTWANATDATCTTNRLLDIDVKVASGNTRLIVNGATKITNTQTTYSPSGSMTIFRTSTGNYPTTGRLYSFKIYDNGTLVRDYIPVYRKADKEIGLYDKVEGKFYENAGSGEFIGYQRIEYIEATGTQYINTGVTGKARWEFDIQFTDLTTRQLMGYGGSGSEYWGVQEDGNYGLATWLYMNKQAGNRDKVIHNYGENNEYYVDVNGTRISMGGTDVTSKEYVLFGLGAGSYPCKAKLYGLKTIQNGVVIRDFVPVYRINDGVVGLYDQINGKFYTNNGSGTLAGYQRIEYIESTGTQWIDSEYNASSNTNIIYDFEYLSGNSGSWIPILGQRVTSGTNMYSFWVNSSTLAVAVNYSTVDTSTIENTNGKGRHRYENVGNKFYLDGVLIKEISTSTFSSSYSLSIFGLRNSATDTETRNLSGRVYSFKIYDNDVLVRDFIPVYRISDGVIGLYDQVEGKFYTNSGTGTFIKGADVAW